MKKSRGSLFETSPRWTRFVAALSARHLDAAVVSDRYNIRALTGIDCDNGLLVVLPKRAPLFFTDFRYVPMVHRCAPLLSVCDIRAFSRAQILPRLKTGRIRLGYEGTITHARYLAWRKVFPETTFVDLASDGAMLRAVKTPSEQAAIRAAAALNDEIWQAAMTRFRAGMTEREMAREIRALMIARGDGEAFDTIVCVGKNAAECHHVPDETVWNGRESVLVDMGVKLNGYCSDMTRNLLPKRPSETYRRVYELVLEANRRAREAVRPGLTAGALDAVARDFLSENGFGAAFGHSLGHGVGLEIHEPPYAAKKNLTPLEPGMIVTIEPGVYLEGNLGVRIEDLVLVTETGYELLSKSEKAHF